MRSAGAHTPTTLNYNSSGWGGAPLASSALLLALGEEAELVEVDGLAAGAAAAVPTLEDGLHQQHRLWECQAGRWAFGSRRSSVRKAWAAVTRAVWWCQPIQERPS
jgi:hypothetical protein